MTDSQRVPVGVRFKEAGKVYYFDAGEAELIVGSYIVVETSHGLEIGRVVVSPDQVLANESKEPLKPILRVATPEDLLLMKLDANRPVDVDDSIAIKDAYLGRLDLSYLRSQADRLGADVRRRLDLLLPVA